MYVAAFTSTRIILAAAAFTLTIVLALTVYTFATSDFGWYGATMTLLVALLAIMAVMRYILDLSMYVVAVIALGVFVFGLYLIWDIKQISGGGRQSMNADDYVVGALILYADIILLFIYILECLSCRK